jgi:hypothetical protein
MCRKLDMQCAATLVVGTVRMLKRQQELSSMSYDDDGFVNATSSAWVLALLAP